MIRSLVVIVPRIALALVFPPFTGPSSAQRLLADADAGAAGGGGAGTR